MLKRKTIILASYSILIVLFLSCQDHDPDVKNEYHPNGKLKFVKRYKNQVLDGQSLWFYENGKIEQTVIFKKGKKMAPHIIFTRVDR